MSLPAPPADGARRNRLLDWGSSALQGDMVTGGSTIVPGTEQGSLVISPASKTDFWSRTHYGFINYNAPVATRTLPDAADWVMETRVTWNPSHQYDQAGLVVIRTPESWAKTSCEYESKDEPSRLGAVVTNCNYSDWSVQDYTGAYDVRYRISKKGDCLSFESQPQGAAHWTLMRIAQLHPLSNTPDPSATLRIGVYACSPTEGGMDATFHYLYIDEVKADDESK